jgi:hypothetical protein
LYAVSRGAGNNFRQSASTHKTISVGPANTASSEKENPINDLIGAGFDLVDQSLKIKSAQIFGR